MAVATAIISVKIKEASIVYAPLRSRSFEGLWVTAVLESGSYTFLIYEMALTRMFLSS